MRRRRTGLALIALSLFVSASAAQGPGYSVRRSIAIGGQGGWDYLAVDTAGNRLFVSHGTQVEVVDLARDTVIGVIPNTPGVHGIALAYDLGRGFVSAGRDSTVTIFDLKTLRVLDRVNVGARNPDAIGYDPYSKRVFTFNGGSSSATALDAATGKVAGSMALPGKPEFWATDGQGRMYVNIEDKSTLVAFDPKALKVLADWPLTGCEEPSGLGFDAAHRRLFPVCGNGKMLVVDAVKGAILATLPIGMGVDGGGFDPGRGYAFASAGEGKLTIASEENGGWTVVQDVPTARGARTMAVDPRTHLVYLSTAEFGPRPDSTASQPRPRPPILPGTFKVLVVGPASP